MTANDLKRITTGVPSLDEILQGGIPRFSIVFVAGLPGSGKTVLCEQALFANAAKAQSVLYLSTLSESVMKMLRFSQRFSWFKPALLGNTVIYGDLGGALRKDGAAGFLRELDQLIEKHRPELVVIDSFKVLRDEFDDERSFRRFAAEVMGLLSTWEATTLLVGEYSGDDIREQAEFAIADGIIYLYGTEEAQRQKRFLRIMKMRGTALFGGEHSFEIGVDGITLYPRLRPEIVGEYSAPLGRMGSTVPGLDEMLGGGPHRSTTTLITGQSGTGKTLVALSFLVQAAMDGARGLFVTLEESPVQVARNVSAFGWDIQRLVDEGALEIIHLSPSEVDIDRHGLEIIERARAIEASVVIIDSISAFEASVGNAARYQSYLWALNDYFKRIGVSVIMTMEGPSLEGTEAKPSARKVSFITDNIVRLDFAWSGAERKRIISVVKMRGSEHDRFMRELVIGDGSINVGEAFESAQLPALLG